MKVPFQPNATIVVEDDDGNLHVVPVEAKWVEHEPLFGVVEIKESRMKKAWQWLKKAGVWTAMVLLALVGAGWIWRRQKSKIGQLQDKVAVEKATTRVKELRAQREILKEQDTETAEEMVRLDEEIADSRLAIRDAFEFGADASEEEIDEELARLGL